MFPPIRRAPSRPATYGLLLLFVLLVRLPSWPISLIDPDEYAFVLAGREVLFGHLPYTTFFDIKPVGSSVLLALAMGLFGVTLATVRAFGAACVFAAAVAVFEAVMALDGRWYRAAGAAVLYAAFTVLLHGLATMTEIVLAPFTCAGAALLARYVVSGVGARRLWLMAGAGLAFGVAIWIKTVPVVPAGILGAAVLLVGLIRRRVGLAAVVGHGGVFAAGCFLPLAITIAVYARAGELGAFVYSNYGFMQSYVHKPPLGVAGVRVVTVLVDLWPLTVAVGVGLVRDARNLLRGRRLSLLAGGSYVWLAAEVAAAVAPLQLFAHYFLPVIPPLSVLAIRVAGQAARALTPALWPRAFAALVVAGVLVPLLPTEWASAVTVFGRTDEQREAAGVIRQQAGQTDTSLLVLSYDFLADYVFTGARLPTRVAIPAHLFGPQSRLVGGDPAATLNAVLAANPRFILIDQANFAHDTPPDMLRIVNAKLACCYTRTAVLPEFWEIDPGVYHLRNVEIFVHSTP